MKREVLSRKSVKKCDQNRAGIVLSVLFRVKFLDNLFPLVSKIPFIQNSIVGLGHHSFKSRLWVKRLPYDEPVPPNNHISFQRFRPTKWQIIHCLGWKAAGWILWRAWRTPALNWYTFITILTHVCRLSKERSISSKRRLVDSYNRFTVRKKNNIDQQLMIKPKTAREWWYILFFYLSVTKKERM